MVEQTITTPEPKKKAVVVKKQRYFVPTLRKTIEATGQAELREIVKKQTAKKSGVKKGKK